MPKINKFKPPHKCQGVYKGTDENHLDIYEECVNPYPADIPDVQTMCDACQKTSSLWFANKPGPAKVAAPVAVAAVAPVKTTIGTFKHDPVEAKKLVPSSASTPSNTLFLAQSESADKTLGEAKNTCKGQYMGSYLGNDERKPCTNPDKQPLRLGMEMCQVCIDATQAAVAGKTSTQSPVKSLTQFNPVPKHRVSRVLKPHVPPPPRSLSPRPIELWPDSTSILPVDIRLEKLRCHKCEKILKMCYVRKEFYIARKPVIHSIPVLYCTTCTKGFAQGSFTHFTSPTFSYEWNNDASMNRLSDEERKLTYTSSNGCTLKRGTHEDAMTENSYRQGWYELQAEIIFM